MMDTGMGSGHLFFDASCHGNMLLLGNNDSVLRGSRSFLNMEDTGSKRRTFFSTSEELMDEDFYDEQLPEKKRRLTPEQVHMLEKSFEAENKLEPEHKTQLAKKLGLQPRQVAVWFQNRRARWKTKQLERDYDLLKSSYDSLRSDHDSILKDNEKLKYEVVTLTEKLQARDAAGMVELGQRFDQPLPSDNDTQVAAIQFNVVKVEDRLSSGSGGSAVVDDDGLQLVDSGDSYFPNDNDYGHCEEDGGGGSDDNRCYFSDVFAAVAQHHQQDEAEPLGWWVWS